MSLVEEKEPTVIALVETKLARDDSFEIPGYTTKKMNRDENGGGVMMLVKEELRNIVVEVEENKEVGEAKWITIDNGRTHIRFGVLYAPQENKTGAKELKIIHKGLKEQIKKAKAGNQEVILVGDFNCKVGEIVPGNYEEMSKGGKMMCKMINK